MVDLKPIESAPKDGTRVLVYREGCSESHVIAWYSKTYESWVSVLGSCFEGATHWVEIENILGTQNG